MFRMIKYFSLNEIKFIIKHRIIHHDYMKMYIVNLLLYKFHITQQEIDSIMNIII